MAEETSARELSNTTFAESFEKLVPAILAEWSELDPKALSETGGVLDKVVALIAEHSAHTKTLVRRQLTELWHVVMDPPRRRPPAASARRGPSSAGATSPLPETADLLLQELEERTAQIMRELRNGVFADTRAKVKDNLLFSLLVSVGLGFIVGVIFTGWNFQRGK